MDYPLNIKLGRVTSGKCGYQKNVGGPSTRSKVTINYDN